MERVESQTQIQPRIHEFIDERVNLHAFIVIDSSRYQTSCGGIRIARDITLEEIKILARSMTLKYCFLQRKINGAKAGIMLPKDVSPLQRQEILEAFGRHAQPLLKNGTYIPWTDINSTIEDLTTIMNAAGCEFHGITDSSYFTALTVLSAMKAACESRAIDLSTASVSIEGFGNVGRHIATGLKKVGGKLIGLSTVQGALYDPQGLDVQKVLKLQTLYDDNLVFHYGGHTLKNKEQLLEMTTDVLIPCARLWTVNNTNMKKIKAKSIVPGANAPLTEEADAFLHHQGVLCLPDFVCNCGGIFGTSLYDNHNSKSKIHDFIMDDFYHLIKEIILVSDRRHCSPTQIAYAVSQKNCQTGLENRQRLGFLLDSYRQRLLHIQLIQQFARGYIAWLSLRNQQRIFAKNRQYLINQL